MKDLFIWLLVSIIIVVSSCSQRTAIEILTKVEPILQDYPDSALKTLSKVDTLSLRTRKSRAEYALLKTIALDKNYIDVQDFSILQPAIDYYPRRGTINQKVKTQYYRGLIYYNMGDYAAASISLGDALQLSASDNDYRTDGMICALLSLVFNHLNNREDELKYADMAHQYFCQYGDRSYIDNSLRALGVSLHNNRRFESADSVLSMIEPSSRYYPSALLYRADNEIKRDNRNASKAIQWFEAAQSKGIALPVIMQYEYAYALLLDNQKGRSQDVLQSLPPHRQDAQTLWWQYMLAKQKGHESEALMKHEAYSSARDSVVKVQLAQSVYRAETQFRREEAKEAVAKMQRIRGEATVITLVSLVLLLIVLAATLRDRLKAEKKRVDAAVSYMESLELLQLDKLKEKESRLATEEELVYLRTVFADLYQKNLKEIGNLYGKNLDFALQLYSSQQQYTERVKEILSEITPKANKHKHFEERLNNDLDNIIEKIRSDYPELKEDQVRFICYIVAGFNNQTISNILKEKNGTVRSKRSRLKNYILSRPTSNTPLFKAFIQ
jgi:hypothetical protein